MREISHTAAANPEKISLSTLVQLNQHLFLIRSFRSCFAHAARARTHTQCQTHPQRGGDTETRARARSTNRSTVCGEMQNDTHTYQWHPRKVRSEGDVYSPPSLHTIQAGLERLEHSTPSTSRRPGSCRRVRCPKQNKLSLSTLTQLNQHLFLIRSSRNCFTHAHTQRARARTHTNTHSVTHPLRCLIAV